jgi:hypothetical protein
MKKLSERIVSITGLVAEEETSAMFIHGALWMPCNSAF